MPPERMFSGVFSGSENQSPQAVDIAMARHYGSRPFGLPLEDERRIIY